MGRKSSVKQLQPEVLKEVNRLLSEGRATLDEILAHLRKLGVEEVSRSALGRHRQQFEKVAAKLRQGREMSEALVRDLGPNAAEGKQGRFLVEILRNLTSDILMERVGGGEDVDPKTLQSLSRTARELSQALRLDQDFELKIRAQVEKEASAKLDKATTQAASEVENGRLTPEQALERVRAIYRGEA